MSVGERLTCAADYTSDTREESIKILEDWLEALHTILQVPNQKPEIMERAKTDAKLILSVKKDIEYTNVNLKLAFELLALKLK